MIEIGVNQMTVICVLTSMGLKDQRGSGGRLLHTKDGMFHVLEHA